MLSWRVVAGHFLGIGRSLVDVLAHRCATRIFGSEHGLSRPVHEFRDGFARSDGPVDHHMNRRCATSGRRFECQIWGPPPGSGPQ